MASKSIMLASRSLSPPAVYSASAFDKLPNHGIYSIPQSRSPPRQSISALWKRDRDSDVRKRGTLDFLKETQMYIENIRKPPVVEVEEHVPRRAPRRKKVTAPPVLPETRGTKHSYSVKYFGNVEGKITVLTTRVPLHQVSKSLIVSPRAPQSKSLLAEVRVPTADSFANSFLQNHKRTHVKRLSLDLSRLSLQKPHSLLSNKKGMLIRLGSAGTTFESLAPTRASPQESAEPSLLPHWESFSSLSRAPARRRCD